MLGLTLKGKGNKIVCLLIRQQFDHQRRRTSVADIQQEKADGLNLFFECHYLGLHLYVVIMLPYITFYFLHSHWRWNDLPTAEA